MRGAPTPTLTSDLRPGGGGGEWESSAGPAAAAPPTPRRPWTRATATARPVAPPPAVLPPCSSQLSCPAAGFISAKELSKALASYGHLQATDKEVEQVIAEATHNADRKISYDVFKRVMMAH